MVNSGQVDEATILSAFSVSHLAQYEGSRVLLVNKGVLPILVHWLASGNRDLQRYAACTVASLCCRPEHRYVDGEHNYSDPPHLDVYTSGWIDALILAEDTVRQLLPLANSEELEVRTQVARALANLSMHPQNRAAIVNASGISSLVILLVQAVRNLPVEHDVALNALSSLFHLALENTFEPNKDSKPGGSCYLIAKEGGLYPLVELLNGPKNKLRLGAIRIIAIMSEHPLSRLAIFQANGLEPLLIIGQHVECGALASEGEGDSATKREELQNATEEAIRVAFTLANLAHTVDSTNSFERRLVTEGSVPVLLHLCKCKNTEVVHQAVRALAQLCTCLTRGFTVADTQGLRLKDGRGGVEKVRPIKSMEETQDEQIRLYQAHETLRMMLRMMYSTNLLTCLEAVRGIGLLALVDDFRVTIVKSSLKELLRLAVDSSGDKELRGLAQEALINLGFEGGARDLELCSNDYSLLMDWFDMERSLEEQKMALGEVVFALEAIMADETILAPVRTAGSGHRLLARDIQPTTVVSPLGNEASGHLWNEGSGGHRGFTGALVDAVRRVVDTRDLLMGCLTPSSDAHDQDEEYREVGIPAVDMTNMDDVPSAVVVSGPSFYTPPPTRFRSGYISSSDPRHQHSRSAGSTKEALSMFLLGCMRDNATQEESEDWGETPGSRSMERLDMSEGGGCRRWLGHGRHRTGDGSPSQAVPMVGLAPTVAGIPEVGYLSITLQRLMDRYFPSRLQQFDLVPLTKYTGLDFGLRTELPWASGDLQSGKPPDFRALVMPSRRFFSFRREGRVISRILKRHGEVTDYWALCFQESVYEPNSEFCTSLLERLHLLPKIKSLVFYSSRRVNTETSLAYLVGNLPGWIRHVTFDNVLSRDALQILGIVLLGRTKNYSGRQQASLALTGIAVRNHPYLRPDDFMPLLDFFRKEWEERSPGGGEAETKVREEETGENDGPPLTKTSSAETSLSRQGSLSTLNYKGVR